MNTYAGIGSKKTPFAVLEQMTSIARELRQRGFHLNSGGAPGADTAFEAGAGNDATIFLPWNGFCGRITDGRKYVVPPLNEVLAKQFHPAPKYLSDAGIKLMSRNSYQVLGLELKIPVKFVLCWTKNGEYVGGTSQAMRIADHHGIPIYNFARPFDIVRFREEQGLHAHAQTRS